MKILYGSTAIVAASMIVSGPTAIAAEKMKLKVGGYMEQWVGFTSQDDGVVRPSHLANSAKGEETPSQLPRGKLSSGVEG